MAALRLVFVLASLCFISACGEPEWDDGYAVLGEPQRAAVDKFMAEDRGRLILCAQSDVNNDGVPDVVLLYDPAKGTRPVPDHSGKAMCVLISGAEGFFASNSLPAPYERQQILFRDIDEKAPLEFVVSGAKDAKTGLGVYRVYDKTVRNLFGESMDECC